MAMAPQASPAIAAIKGGSAAAPAEDSVAVAAVFAVAQWIVDNHHNSNGVGEQVFEARGGGVYFIGIKYCGGGTAPTSKIGTLYRAGRYDGLSWRKDTA